MKTKNTKPIYEKGTIIGSYVIKTYRAGTKELIRQTQPIKNLIVNGSTGYGKNLIARALLGSSWTTAYSIVIDSASIGTGSTAPASSDTNLQTPVLTGVTVAFGEFTTASEIILSFFIASASLANGTYTEFGLFCNGKLFARSLITPSYVKGDNEDSSVEYTISII